MILGATDGKYYICSKGGQVDKAIDAHNGAVLCIQWNFDGSAICTGNY
jgi:intraflagellar transport protein 80